MSAQTKLGIIKDSDGFVNIREGAGIEFPVLTKIDDTDFFYFSTQDNGDWQKIRLFKETQLTGFIHKSRIQEFEKVPDRKQNELIITTLKNQRELAEIFNSTVDSKEHKFYFAARKTLENHSESKYDAILNILSTYFCRTKDLQVLREFLATIWADKGSANEIVSVAIADCFNCKSDFVIKEIGDLENSEVRNLLYNQIEWGLINHFNSDNKEFLRLKALLDKVRKEMK